MISYCNSCEKLTNNYQDHKQSEKGYENIDVNCEDCHYIKYTYSTEKVNNENKN